MPKTVIVVRRRRRHSSTLASMDNWDQTREESAPGFEVAKAIYFLAFLILGVAILKAGFDNGMLEAVANR